MSETPPGSSPPPTERHGKAAVVVLLEVFAAACAKASVDAVTRKAYGQFTVLLIVAVGLSMTGVFWTRVSHFLGPRLSESALRAATDARTWIAVILALLVCEAVGPVASRVMNGYALSVQTARTSPLEAVSAPSNATRIAPSNLPITAFQAPPSGVPALKIFGGLYPPLRRGPPTNLTPAQYIALFHGRAPGQAREDVRSFDYMQMTVTGRIDTFEPGPSSSIVGVTDKDGIRSDCVFDNQGDAEASSYGYGATLRMTGTIQPYEDGKFMQLGDCVIGGPR